MTPDPLHTLIQWHGTGISCAIVSVSEVLGSTPREAGAWMVVSDSATAGTIGGGRLEEEAIQAARSLLREGPSRSVLDVPLGPELGQCCGGRAVLEVRKADAVVVGERVASESAARSQRPAVFIHGSGHVGRALARALSPLPLVVTVVDSRAEELARITDAPGVRLVHSDQPVRVAEQAPAGAAHVVLTHSHALDSLIVSALLERGDFAYLGLIGSATKRATFERALRQTGFQENMTARITCPIGGNAIRDKRPEVIAAFTAAEILSRVLGEDGE